MANRLFNKTATILDVTGKTATYDGAAYLLAPIDGDEIDGQNQEFRAFFVVTTTGGASTPTADLIVQTSNDNVNWLTWVAATQVTTATTLVELKGATSLDCGRYVRAKLSLGGGTAFTTAAKLQILSNGRFTATAV